MTETLAHNGFTLSEITLKDEVLTNSDSFELLIGDANDYCTPELESVTLQDKLQEISILNEVHIGDSDLMTPISGIEATDVCSLYEQFLEYEQASDAEPLSYPESSVMSPDASPGQKNNDVVLDRLISVQEKLSREVASDGDSIPVENVVNDNLVMNIPNDDKLVRTVNGIHPKGNLLRMADSPKFAKFKKKRLTNDPPLRIASSLPNTPRCTSPSDAVSSEERKHMEIKLIEALALPMPNKNPKAKDKNTKDIKSTKDIKNSKDNKNGKENPKKPPCPIKRKQPPVEPIPSRLLPVVSKRQRNNIDNKLVKDPRLKEQGGVCVDPRLSKPDYCTKLNITQLKTTNLIELNSSTNTATETVDDVGIIDMTIDHEKLPDSVIVTTNVTIDHDKLSETVIANNVTIDHEALSETVIDSNITINHESLLDPVVMNGITPNIEKSPDPAVFTDGTMIDHGKLNDIVALPSCDPVCKTMDENDVSPIIKKESMSPDRDNVPQTVEESSALEIVEFPSISAIEIKTEEVTEEICSSETIKNKKEISPCGLIKPEKNYRKTPSVVNENYSSGSERECDDDDRAYNRKKLSKKSNSLSKKHSHSIKRSQSSSRVDKSRSRSLSKNPLNNSRHSTRRHSKSPTRKRSRSRKRRRSLSPGEPKMRSDLHSSESSYSCSDRSDGENLDISNKLIELSNPVPYDIEHERKLRFLSGGANKGMGERRNIYAGGITENTTKPELAERFRRFGKISKITLHFREKGDNYAFIVFEDPDNAMRAIEEGNDDPNYPHLDLCFGGRRKFVGGSYVDFDGNNRYLEESDKTSINNRCEPEEDDFDRLLQLAMNERKKRETTPECKKRETTTECRKREATPEWS